MTKDAATMIGLELPDDVALGVEQRLIVLMLQRRAKVDGIDLDGAAGLGLDGVDQAVRRPVAHADHPPIPSS